MTSKAEKEKNRERNRGTTSIKVDPELWKDVKIEAIRRDIEVSHLVENALRKEIGKPIREAQRSP